MTQQKPTSYLSWVPDEASTNLAQPPTSISANGFGAGQPLIAPYINYCFHNLSSWTRYLSEQSNATVLATSLNHSMRLLGGGTLSFDVASRTLAWSAPFIFAVPSSQDSANVLPASSVMLPSGSVAYVQANLPFTTTGDVTSGSATVANLGYETGIVAGMQASGPGIPSGTTVQSVGDTSCLLSQPATATSAQATLTFVSTGSLRVLVASSAALVPGPTTVILARAMDSVCSVGIGATEVWLRDQERRSLVSLGYVTTVVAPAGESLAAQKPVYMSTGAADSRTQGSVYQTDSSASNGLQRGQCIGFTHTATASASSAHIVQSGILGGFSGLQVGAPYYLDPSSVGGITASQPTVTGVFRSPVGIATSASTLLVQLHPPTQVTKQGSLAAVDFGSLWQTQSNGTTQLGGIQRKTLNNDQTSSAGLAPRLYTTPASGSVLNISGMAFSSVAGYAQFAIRVNQTFGPLFQVNIAAGTMAYPSFDISEGTQLFAKGDQLSLYVTFFKSDGTILSNANVQSYGDTCLKFYT